MSATASGEVLRLTGALDFETLPAVIAEAEKYVGQADLPQRLTIDFSGVTGVDSSAVALLLDWRRRAIERRIALEFEHLPENLLALAQLYGVADLIRSGANGDAA
ncbi:MAG TPA: STAS domain-containing protein [Usitatibacter sp.]|nr:STAS domain-containing protein [Usitatibacter sp.]